MLGGCKGECPDDGAPFAGGGSLFPASLFSLSFQGSPVRGTIGKMPRPHPLPWLCLLCLAGGAAPAALAAPPENPLTRASLEAAGAAASLGPAAPLWLNPGADLHLRPGESVTLRYALPPALRQEDLAQSGFSVSAAEGLAAELLHLRGSGGAAIRLTNTGLPEGAEVRAAWLLPGGQSFSLPAVTGAAGSTEGQVLPWSGRPVPGSTAPNSVNPDSTPPGGAGRPAPAGRSSAWGTALWWLLTLGLLAGVLAYGWRQYRRQQGGALAEGTRQGSLVERARQASLVERARQAAPKRHVTVAQAQPVRPPDAASAFAAQPPAIEGLEYAQDGILCLFSPDGRMGVVNVPASGAFDVGQVARVPHLSGLRLEKHRAGLQLLRVPADLEVSQGTRLLTPGDVVRPGTLLGVQMAESAHARTPPLGELSGLGLPLTLSADGQRLKVVGRYAEHHLGLPAGVTDLGDTCKAPSLRGLRLTLLGGRILIADIPPRLSLYRPRVRGEGSAHGAEPLRPGTFLPQGTEIHFKGYEETP